MDETHIFHYVIIFMFFENLLLVFHCQMFTFVGKILTDSICFRHEHQ